MKKQWMIICFVVTATIGMLFSGCGNSQQDVNSGLQYDNTSDKHDLITVTYSEKEIEMLKSKIEERGYDEYYYYSELKEDFKIECIRKTPKGYYAALLLDNGRDVYIYITEDLIVGEIEIYDHYLSKDDFDNVTTHEEVLLLDPNTGHSPMSAAIVTHHTVQEGIIHIFYNRLPPYQYNPKVDEIRFYSHEDLIEKGMHFILEIDKKNK